uniref:Smr domain-containing protein n=1 Tax=Caenorhabditis tropicalis TaxID=1561998 RepID=A0A1I7UDR3_9PELO
MVKQPRRQDQQRQLAPRSERVTVVHSRALLDKKEKLQKEVQALWASKKGKTHQERQQIDAKIDGKVVAYNLNDLKRRRYYDLHGMTLEGALVFVHSVMEATKDREPVQFETGKGNHSRNGVARIKPLLLETFGRLEEFRIDVDGNEGIVNVRRCFSS